jgi:FkbM family methyltransferase
MRKYYSQHGEDYLLWSLFAGKKNKGFFVEVGALDGIRFSNTYSFELEGWSGVCVEPHPEYFALLERNRPNSHCIESAAGNREGFVEFYAEPRGEFSTLVREIVEDERYESKMAGYKKIEVPISSLTRILEDVESPSPIDIVSIDVEGAELSVLEGFDFSYYNPRVLIIEANGSGANKSIDKYMKNKGYHKSGRLFSNNFYCRDFADAVRIAVTPLKCKLSIAPHPLYPKKGVSDKWQIKRVDEERLLAKSCRTLIKGIYINLRRLMVKHLKV